MAKPSGLMALGLTEIARFLGQKWMRRAGTTYEARKSAAIWQLSITMTNPLFSPSSLMDSTSNARFLPPRRRPCATRQGDETLALDLQHIQTATGCRGVKLYHKTRRGVTFPLADALCGARRPAIHPRRHGTGNQGARTRRWRWTPRTVASSPTLPCPGAAPRRSRTHLRESFTVQSSPRGPGGLPHLL